MYISKEKKEIGLLWQRVASLEKAYDESKSKIIELEESAKTAPISQQEAKKASQSATQYKVIVKKIKETIKEDSESIEQLLKDLDESVKTAKSNTELTNQLSNECLSSKDSAEENNSKVADLYNEIFEQVESLQTVIAENHNLSADLENTRELLLESTNDHNKIKSLLKETASVNNKVKGLYDEIYGYEIARDEHELDDEPTFIEGLKEKLEKSYSGLNERITESTEHLELLTKNTESSYQEVTEEVKSNYDQFIDKCGKTYEKTHSRIKDLLPDALTAGLSSAYDKKKEEEVITQKDATFSFQMAILGLIVISLIPFAIDVYLIVVLEQELVKVIEGTPKLLISILPLYFPVLWMAYSSNKKANLSKRLIEEYTHKGVLSKTYEGLSTQITDLDQNDISSELRVKLLFNLLEVNSENPGKLISNYNSSDHPLMDALDKSAKLASAVEKLSKIPGFSKLAGNLERKGKKLLDIADQRSAAVLGDADDKKEPDAKKDSSIAA